ncbi:hypothetical protein QFZ73_001448 [Peribacillus sp. V2I11]|nr:hypothetical protein [Peribacillus sp. V2I11]
MGILSGNPKEEPMHYGEVFGMGISDNNKRFDCLSSNYA